MSISEGDARIQPSAGATGALLAVEGLCIEGKSEDTLAPRSSRAST